MKMNQSALRQALTFLRCKNEYSLTNLIFNISLAANTTNLTTLIPKCTSTPYKQLPQDGEHDYLQITARVFYIVVLIIGTIGNVLACYIIITRKFMRRIIHIYTFNLAISDLIVVLFYVPVEIVRNEHDLQWTMGSAMCSLNNLAAPTSIVASICTLVAITLDRHRGVTKPFLWRGDSRKVLKFTIPAIWIIALVSSAPLFFVAKVVHENNASYCVEQFSSRTAMKAYWITMFALQVVVPLFIIVIANTHMIWAMQRLSRQMQQEEQHKQHKRMIRMVVLLVLVYAVCSSPQHIVFFWFVYGDLEQRHELSKNLFKAANLLIIVQSAINPIIYGTGRSDFKRAFKAILYCVKFREYLPMREAAGKSVLIANDAKSSHIDQASQDFSFPELTPNADIAKPDNKAFKFIQYNITDTPPVNRKDIFNRPLRKSEPVGPKCKNGYTGNAKHLSLPNGKVSLSKATTGTPIQQQNGITQENNREDQLIIEICVDELQNLINAPETIL